MDYRRTYHNIIRSGGRRDWKEISDYNKNKMHNE